MISQLRSINTSILLSFLLPLLYWVYLLKASDMIVAFDAISYHELAELFLSEGWMGYLREGPAREPFYPWLLSLSMRGEEIFNISYFKIQTVFQAGVMFLTQLLMYRALRMLHVRTGIIALTLAYFGFSPALVNSAFSLFSEIVTYPLVLGIIFISVKSAQSIINGNVKITAGLSLVMVALAGLLIFTKAMMEYAFILYLLPFAAITLSAVWRIKGRQARAGIVFLVIFFSCTQGLIQGYKALNLHFNGIYTFTDFRGPYLFYHYAAKRTEPLSRELFLKFVLSIPGEKVCRSVFGRGCDDLWWDNYSYASRRHEQLRNAGIPENKILGELTKEGLWLAMASPFQYAFFTACEALKFLFWESTQIGNVQYPLWLQNLFDFVVLKNSLRLLLSVLTALSLAFILRLLIHGRGRLFASDGSENQKAAYLFFLLIFILIYACLYSSVIVITRYAFSLAPLYLIAAAVTLDHLMKRE